MAIEKHIVVWDPRLECEGGYGQGSLVDEREARVIQGLGACALPVDASLFEFSGVGGFAFRRWGSGWPLDLTPRRVCPVTLFCPGRHGVVHWAARFVAVDARTLELLEQGKRLEGEARITGDTSQHNPQQPPLAADDSKVTLAELRFSGLPHGPACGDHGPGAVAGGRIKITPSQSTYGTHYPFALWARGAGLAVQWLALTWSER